jgi:hypothetical protein
LEHARKVGRAAAVVEWPGGEPREVQIRVERQLFARLMAERTSIPFPADRLREFAGLPWGSLATIQRESDDKTRNVLVGPARFAWSSKGESYWYLPVIEKANPLVSKESLVDAAAKWRTAHGLDMRESR